MGQSLKGGGGGVLFKRDEPNIGSIALKILKVCIDKQNNPHAKVSLLKAIRKMLKRIFVVLSKGRKHTHTHIQSCKPIVG